mmetsp:Transcript_6278/g.19383  ORF Transcript_6278/g.19383 Transcript_6278/m.19383 type:complete len:324 (-) Transcript_6278:47-1018(-)
MGPDAHLPCGSRMMPRTASSSGFSHASSEEPPAASRAHAPHASAATALKYGTLALALRACFEYASATAAVRDLAATDSVARASWYSATVSEYAACAAATALATCDARSGAAPPCATTPAATGAGRMERAKPNHRLVSAAASDSTSSTTDFQVRPTSSRVAKRRRPSACALSQRRHASCCATTETDAARIEIAGQTRLRSVFVRTSLSRAARALRPKISGAAAFAGSASDGASRTGNPRGAAAATTGGRVFCSVKGGARSSTAKSRGVSSESDVAVAPTTTQTGSTALTRSADDKISSASAAARVAMAEISCAFAAAAAPCHSS